MSCFFFFCLVYLIPRARNDLVNSSRLRCILFHPPLSQQFTVFTCFWDAENMQSPHRKSNPATLHCEVAVLTSRHLFVFAAPLLFLDPCNFWYCMCMRDWMKTSSPKFAHGPYQMTTKINKLVQDCSSENWCFVFLHSMTWMTLFDLKQ